MDLTTSTDYSKIFNTSTTGGYVPASIDTEKKRPSESEIKEEQISKLLEAGFTKDETTALLDAIDTAREEKMASIETDSTTAKTPPSPEEMQAELKTTVESVIGSDDTEKVSAAVAALMPPPKPIEEAKAGSSTFNGLTADAYGSSSYLGDNKVAGINSELFA